MKWKVVTVDLEIPARVKRWVLRVGIPACVLLGGGALAWAGLPHTFADGQVLSAQDLDDNFNALDTRLTAVQGQVHAASAFRAWTSNAVPIPGSGFPLTVAFDQVDYDLAGEYDAGTGVFTPKASGVYLVTCAFEFNAAATAYYTADLVDNGAELGVSEQYVAVSGQISREYSSVIQLAAGDSVVCGAAQSSGTSQVLMGGHPGRNMFSAARLY
jgi:hypothetical protein